jgi:hypothetical protein
MPLRQMQIDRRLLKVAVSEQHLDGAQVGAGFKKVGGKAVPQRMRMDVLVGEAGALGGRLTGNPEDLGGDGITCRMPSVAGKKPVGLRRSPRQ